MYIKNTPSPSLDCRTNSILILVTDLYFVLCRINIEKEENLGRACLRKDISSLIGKRCSNNPYYNCFHLIIHLETNYLVHFFIVKSKQEHSLHDIHAMLCISSYSLALQEFY